MQSFYNDRLAFLQNSNFFIKTPMSRDKIKMCQMNLMPLMERIDLLIK